MSNLGRRGRGSQGSCTYQLFRSGFVLSGFPSSCFPASKQTLALTWVAPVPSASGWAGTSKFKLAQRTQWTSAIYTSRDFGPCIFFAFLPPKILPCNPALLCGFALSDVFMSAPCLTFWQIFCTVPCYCKPGAFILNEGFPGKRKKNKQ